jgi:hypothetical protein
MPITGDQLNAQLRGIRGLQALARPSEPRHATAVTWASSTMTDLYTALKLPPGVEVDDAAWKALAEAVRIQHEASLVAVERALKQALELDGPIDPSHLMADQYASTCWIFVLAAIAVIGTVLVGWQIVARWDAATQGVSNQAPGLKPGAPAPPKEPVPGPAAADKKGADQPAAEPTPDAKSVPGEKKDGKDAKKIEEPAPTLKPPESVVLTMVLLLGAFGGFLHYTKSFAGFVGNRQFKRSWILYYLLMPFEGAGLAAIAYLLLRVGVLSPGATTGELNLIGLYAFAALTGLFSKQALEKLYEVFSTVFTKIKARDPQTDPKK